MKYLSVAEYAEQYGVSERTVRNYCCQGMPCQWNSSLHYYRGFETFLLPWTSAMAYHP